ncbi:hypothetical protein PHYSODRAFT_295168 [Phytophthora sojae]|uniref:Uncharacterized protein n=1 Tax=Phytophthora sojae (strain P6497) TaxID=1094619 RepID=G4YLG6_PHYSP|nr:hypothetical protein PHYSODRAFT_295168 [Phytophthora sojae]EGZ30340.1 hypothetical protein PHYSODRAFT_295168 [Phytophthora sojae]|eukprot:XP_009517615.1 hypothetical protein PHYSODRAFT_295168 [Phytophthora sojae]
MAAGQRLKGGRNAKRRQSRKQETALQREERLSSARVAAQRRREQKRIEEREKLQELSSHALDAVKFSREDIELVAAGQQYTKDPRLALIYYYCCGPDPRGFVFGDEQLNGENGEEAQNRLKDMFSDYPKPENVGACQKLTSELESEAVDIWACASCGRILLGGGGSDKVVVKSLVDLPPRLS